MPKQFLEDQLAHFNKALEKADVAEFTTSLDVGRDALAEAEKSLAAGEESQDASRSSCVQVASDHEASVKAFAEELKAWADATKVLQTKTGKDAFTVSREFISWSETSTHLAGFEVVSMVRRLAKKEHCAALSQLALRISAIHSRRRLRLRPVRSVLG